MRYRNKCSNIVSLPRLRIVEEGKEGRMMEENKRELLRLLEAATANQVLILLRTARAIIKA